MPLASLIKTSQVLLSICFTPGTILDAKVPPADHRPFLLSGSFILVMETDGSGNQSRGIHTASMLQRREMTGSCERLCPGTEEEVSEKVTFQLKLEPMGAIPEIGGEGSPAQGTAQALGRDDHDLVGKPRSAKAHHGRPCGPC